uniref:Transmembrane protein n=1 Tax=Caenorhabditis japonica TaxID=281687 RepID=A0A8R1HST7_CAEJA
MVYYTIYTIYDTGSFYQPAIPGTGLNSECPDELPVCSIPLKSPYLLLSPYFFRFFGIFVELLYLICYTFLPAFRNIFRSPFFDMVLVYCAALLIRTSFTMLLLVYCWIQLTQPSPVDESFLFFIMQLSLLVHLFGDYFSMIMIFFLALYRCLLFKAKELSERIFEGYIKNELNYIQGNEPGVRKRARTHKDNAQQSF